MNDDSWFFVFFDYDRLRELRMRVTADDDVDAFDLVGKLEVIVPAAIIIAEMSEGDNLIDALLLECLDRGFR